jgi:hypothetical protein
MTEPTSTPAPADTPAPSTTADRSLTVGLIGLFAAILGVALMTYGFLAGIDAAFSGSGAGAALYTAVFILGGLFVLAALVFAIVRLVQRRSRVLSVVTIVIALVPIAGVVLLRLAATGAFV